LHVKYLAIVIVDTQLHKQITITPERAKITHVYYTIEHEGGRHIDNVYISGADYSYQLQDGFQPTCS